MRFWNLSEPKRKLRHCESREKLEMMKIAKVQARFENFSLIWRIFCLFEVPCSRKIWNKKFGSSKTCLFIAYGRALFEPLFCRGPFLHCFCPSEKAKSAHSRISAEKMKKISDYVFFILVIFLQRRETFAYFCLYFQIFYVFNKLNPTYQQFNQKSVSYIWNPWVSHFLH